MRIKTGGHIMECIGRDIYGGRYYERKIEDSSAIYMETMKTPIEKIADFFVGKHGWKHTMDKEESKEYYAGVLGHIGAFIDKEPDEYRLILDNGTQKYSFASFYTEDGQLIKKLLIIFPEGKLYMCDGNDYYEATTDAKKPGRKTNEKFIAKDDEHRLKLPEDISRKKEYYSKIFLEMYNNF